MIATLVLEVNFTPHKFYLSLRGDVIVRYQMWLLLGYLQGGSKARRAAY